MRGLVARPIQIALMPAVIAPKRLQAVDEPFFISLKNRTASRNGRKRGLTLFLCAVLGPTLSFAQARNVSLELTSHESKSVELALAENVASPVQVRLEGGIVGVTATGPRGEKRPLWVIDLGRGATLLYPVGGAAAGNYTITVTSYERERLAHVTLNLPDPVRSDEKLLKLRTLEDDLANAELVRRHWPNAVPGLDAQQAFERASEEAERLDMVPLERLALTQEARLLMFAKGQYLPARTLLEKAVKLPPADDDAIQALMWKTLSSVQYDLGEFRAAIDDGERASALYRKTNDLYWQGIVLGNLAADYSELGLEDEALAAVRKALDDAKEEHDPAGLVYCLGQLAGLYSRRGDLQSAFRAFSEGIQWASGIGYAPLVEAEIQKDLGVFSVQAGDWDQAQRALHRALQIEGNREDPVTVEAVGALARVLLHENKPSLALARTNTAISIAHKLELRSDEAELLLNRAEIKRTLGEEADSLSDIAHADLIGTATDALPLRIRAYQAWGDALLIGQATQAEGKYQQALEWAQQTGEREQQAEAMVGIARAKREQGHARDALQSVDSALEILDQADRSLSSIDLQASYLHLHRDWYELAIDLCMELDRNHPESGFAERAFSFSERAHSRALLAILRRSSYNPESGMTEEMRIAYARNRQTIEAEELKLAHASDEDRVASAARLQRLFRERDGIESQALSTDDRLHSLLVDQTADVPSVEKELLSEHSVLVSYWVGEEQSYRWTITAHSFTVRTLTNRARLEKQIVPVERAMRNAAPAALAGETAPIYLQRQRKLESQLEVGLRRAGSLLLSDLPHATRELLVVRDGCLLSMSFAALRLIGDRGPEYALQLYRIKVEPSASVALYLRQHQLTGQRNSIAVIADPILSLRDPRVSTMGVSAKQARDPFSIPRLTGSEREAQQILRFAQPDSVLLRTGFDATPAKVEELPFSRIFDLHFATHTISFPRHPDISGIALSMFDKEGFARDGVLWTHDIDRLRISVPMVVLSGCDTDGVEDGVGERTNSLSYAFFFAGVRSVLASLWNVDDNATSGLMAHFYMHTLGGVSADEALRAAQLEMMAQRETSSPAKWAAFVIEGWPQSLSAEIINGRKATARKPHKIMRR